MNSKEKLYGSIDHSDLIAYVKLVRYIANDYHELSYDKAYSQRDWWKKLCKELMEKHPIEDEQ